MFQKMKNHRRCKSESFCCFSVSRAPSVTLTRATFLPEEGSWRCTALPQKKNVRIFAFEVLKISFVFSAAQSRKSHRLMAPLCKGSSREAGEGLFGRHQICKNSFAVVRHKPTSCRNRNTPQSAVRLTAPLLKRGQPLREQTAARKKQNVPPFSPAGSFRHAHACHLPPRKAHVYALHCRRGKTGRR